MLQKLLYSGKLLQMFVTLRVTRVFSQRIFSQNFTYNPMNELPYPHYFRKAGHCLKRVSDTQTTEIIVPDQDQSLPLCHQNVTYPSKQRLDETISRMDPVDKPTYESYLATFFQRADKNRTQFNEIRQRRFESGVVKASTWLLIISRQIFQI
jgi:hypothetical protein